MENLELPRFAGPEIAGPARPDAPFVLAGRHAVATGVEATGIEELRVHPYRVLRRLRLAEAEAVAVRATPAGLERLLELDGRQLLERSFVPAAAPGAILEWEVVPARMASSACFEPVELELEWSCDLEDGARVAPGLRGSARGHRLLVEAADGRAAAFEGSRTLSAAVEANGGAADGVRCRIGVRLAPGERFRLAVAAAADAGGLERALAELADPAAAIQARAAAAQRRLAGGLSLGAPVPAAGQAVRWALLRLPSFVAELRASGFAGGGEAALAGGYPLTGGPQPSAAAARHVGLAALAAGDHALGLEVAQIALAEAERADEPPGEARAAGLLLHALHYLWSGQDAPVAAAWPRLMALAAAMEPAAAAASAAAPAAAALERLALAAESLGRATDAATLRARGTRLASAQGGARALAEAGGWAAWSEPRADAAAGWLERAIAGLAPARALWRGPAGASDATATAAVIVGAAHGLLGLDPDAPRARLRLRPQIPIGWDRVDVDRIRVGDAEIRLAYALRDRVHRFRLEQVGGAVPLRAVLEPAVPGSVRGTRVDGAPASLDRRSFGDRTLVPVQLVLDDRRLLEVEVEE